MNMRARIGFGLAVVAILSALLVLALLQDPSRIPSTLPAPAVQAQEQGASAGGVAPAPAASTPSNMHPPDTDAPRSPAVQALARVAELTNQRWARCKLPDDLGPDVHTMDPRVETVEDGHLLLLLDEQSAGWDLWLQESSQFLPSALVSFGPGPRGGQVDCTVHDEQVDVRVRVRLADGSPAEGANAVASWGGRAGIADADGWASVTAWKGLDTTINARIKGEARGWVQVPAPQGGEQFELVLDTDPGESHTLTDAEVAAQKDARANKGLDLSDALEAALADERLSPEARERIIAWSSGLQRQADADLELADEIAADTDGDPLSRHAR